MNVCSTPARSPIHRMYLSGPICRYLAAVLLPWLAAAARAQPPGGSDTGPPPATVVVAKVQQSRLDTRQTFVGTVMPSRTSTVGSSVEGLVVELAVNEGDRVVKGQTLAQLRDEQLKLQLAVAAAELEARTQELSELKISLPEELKQANARMMAAKALMEFTTRRLKRTRKLVASRTISEDELQEKESAALAAEEKYREAKTAWDQAGAVLPVKLKRAEAQVDAQRRAIDRLKDDLAQLRIEAPFGGYVTKEHTEVGQWIAKGDPVVEVIELDYVEVEVPVLESYLSQLQLQMKATVTIGALPGQSFEGQVAAIVPQADVRSRSFPVKLRLKNRQGPGGVLLKSGMFARVTLPIGSKPRALLVPKDAVVLGGPKPVVYVVDPIPSSPAAKRRPAESESSARGPSAGGAIDGVARMVPVELRRSKGNLIEVSGALKQGDRVVVEGNERLFSGQPLIITE